MPTTTNGLPYPAPSAAPNVPADIQAGMEAVDAWGTWNDYTPTLGWTNTTATVAKWVKQGKLVTVQFLLTLTGTPVGTFSMTLPSTSGATANRVAAGTAMLIDGASDTTRRSATVFLLSTTTFGLLVDSATSSALVSTTVPWTWATTDTIGGTLTYREA
jgi:hypothetical protein